MPRKQHWEEVYTRKSPLEVSWYQREPRLSFELISATGEPRDAPVIDVGGGASVLVDRLLDAGFTDLTVLDISGRALEHARRRLGARAAAVRWLEADITAFRLPRAYRVWHDRAVFHFLTDANDRRAYVAALQHGLAIGGQLVIAAFAVGGPLQCSGLDIVQYDAATLAAELGSGFELVEERRERHRTPGGKDQRFGYFRCRRNH